MSEDKKLAEKMAIEELRNTVRVGRDLGIPQQVVSYEHGIPEKDLPPGDGDGMMLPIVIGMRGRLSKSEARKAARMWCHAIARYPKAIFYLNMVGYDQDPREIWEIVDAARYVRWFARAAGLDDMDTALRILRPGSSTWEAGVANQNNDWRCGAIHTLVSRKGAPEMSVEMKVPVVIDIQ